MAWPSPHEFNEAVQSPKVSFSDPELRAGMPELNHLGLPVPMSGAFACVYRFHCENRDVAVRCFLNDFSDNRKRYEQISRYVMNDDLPYTVDFHYIEKGIKINGRFYPILKMDWVEGVPLDQYISKAKSEPQKLKDLLGEFKKMILDLKTAGIAHGDLQHGNILVTTSGLRLVDYDGMYVPELYGWRSHEVGHRNYQHPARGASDFGPETDNFSSWIIALALEAVIYDARYWSGKRRDECLLLHHADLKNPAQSPVFQALFSCPDSYVRGMAHVIAQLVEVEVHSVPALAGPEKLKSVLDLLGTLPRLKVLSGQASSQKSSALDKKWYEPFLPLLDSAMVMGDALAALEEGNYLTAVGYLSQLIEAKAEVAEALSRRAQAYIALQRHNDAAADALELKKQLLQTSNLKNKHYAEYCQLIAGSLFEVGKFDEARDIVEAWCRIEPRNIRALLFSGRLLMHRSQFRKAVDVFSRIIKDNEDEATIVPQALILRAECYVSLKTYAAAKSDVGLFLSRFGKENQDRTRSSPVSGPRTQLARALYLRGEALAGENKAADAIADFGLSIEEFPTAAAHLSRGSILRMQRKFDEAVLDFLECARRTSDRQIAALSQEEAGICLFETCRYVEASDIFRKALALRLKNELSTARARAAYQASAGLTELENRNWKDAVLFLERAESSAPIRDLRVTFALGIASSRLKEKNTALKCFNLCSLNADADKLGRIALELYSLGANSEADAYAERAISRGGKSFLPRVASARRLRQKREHRKAEEICRKVLLEDPSNYWAMNELAACQECDGKVYDAMMVCKTVISLHPFEVDPLLRAAHLADRMGDPGAALDFLERCLSLDKTVHAAHLHKIVVCQKLSHKRKAQSAAEALTKEYSHLYAAWFLLANASDGSDPQVSTVACEEALKIARSHSLAMILASNYEMLNNTNQADRVVKRLREEYLGRHDVRAFVGQHFLRRKWWQKAAFEFLESLRLAPTKQAWAGRGHALRWLGKEEQFLAELNSGLKSGTVDEWTFMFERGKILRRLRQFEKAVKCFERMAELDPVSRIPSVQMVKTLISEHRLSEAETFLNGLAWVETDTPEALALKAAISISDGNSRDAASLFGRLRKLFPDWADQELAGYFALRGRETQFEKDDPKHALEDYNQAILLDPDSPYFLCCRASASLQLKRMQSALTDFQQANKLDPFSKTAIVGLISIFAELDDPVQTCKYLDQYLELDPLASSFRFKRAVIKKRLNEREGAIEDFMVTAQDKRYRLESVKSLAILYQEKREYDKSIEKTLEALELLPDDLGLYVSIAVCYFELKEHKRSRLWIDRAAKMAEKQFRQGLKTSKRKAGEIQTSTMASSVYVIRARMFVSLGEFPKAVTDYRRACAISFKEDSMEYRNCVNLAKQKSYTKAIAGFEKLLDGVTRTAASELPLASTK